LPKDKIRSKLKYFFFHHLNALSSAVLSASSNAAALGARANLALTTICKSDCDTFFGIACVSGSAGGGVDDDDDQRA
jgi:hypothetical protein